MNSKFSFLDLKSNDNLSCLNKKDLNEFIKCLLNYNLKLKDTLNLDKNLTFGLEIEFEKVNNLDMFTKYFNLLKLNEGIVKSSLNNLHLWNLETDMSLLAFNGREITSPVLIDDEKYWKDLQAVCSYIKLNARIDKHCAGHIHIGSQVIGNNTNALMNFIKLWGVYENVLYRFGYNEYLNKNDGIKYCNSCAVKFLEGYNALKNINGINTDNIVSILGNRPSAVNLLGFSNLTKGIFIANKDTIEFRSPNGTLDPVIWQNNLNTFMKMLIYSKKSNFDMDTVLKREHNNKVIGNVNEYNKIYLNEAIEFADLIFNNNLDKVYFLRQYIKNNDVSSESMKLTRKFTI